MRRLIRTAFAGVALLVAGIAPVSAHPLGNFTVNHLSRIKVSRGAAQVRYTLDLAEIPTFSLDRSLDPHGAPTDRALSQWAREHAAQTAGLLTLTIDGRRIALRPAAWSARHRAGAGGLPTLAFSASYTAPLGPGAHRLAYRDDSAPGRLGWKDVVLGDAREPTNGLRRYPDALAGSPRDRTQIRALLDGSGGISAGPNETADPSPAPPLTRSNGLSDLLATGSSDPLVILGALLIAIALGALHALEPGHGKTLLAVSLVGARATPRQALILASALTIAHTAGVLVLGLVVLVAARWIVPEQIYPWIALGSGGFVAILGSRALARELHGRLPAGHAHEHGRLHAHAHPHPHSAPENGSASLRFRDAVLAAASGNLAPCPAALVVLLAAISLHRVGYGLALIVAFSVGLAAVLTALGMAVVSGAAWLVERPRFEAAARTAPLITALAIALIGAVMIGQAAAAQGLGAPAPVIAALVLVAIFGHAFTQHRHHFAGEARA